MRRENKRVVSLLTAKKPGKLTVGKFRVVSNNTGVAFAIDQQGFELKVEYDDSLTKKQNVERYKWYARMLRKALRRLQAGKRS